MSTTAPAPPASATPPPSPSAPPQAGPDASWLRTVIRYDLPASVVVFLVALPLSVGIALASNAPVMAGLIAAIIGGIVAGILGGSPLLASGPAAGLTVVVAEMIQEFGWKVTCLITVGAGILQIILGLSRIARAALAISPVVVHAMLAGIGITIALQQMHVLLGGQSNSTAWENIKELPNQILHCSLGDVFIGVTVIVVLLAWRWAPSKIAVIPGPLVAIVLATVLSLVLPVNVVRITIDGSLFDAIALPGIPHVALNEWFEIAAAVLTIALIASVESLLSAVAVDKMHTGPKSDLDRELIGQGAANSLSGLLGGLPITGVIVRSATNVAAGARTRASTILHGVWVLVFTVFFVGVIQQVPKAALAGLLIVIGIQLVKLAHIRLARRTGDLWVYGITAGGVVFLNLLEGVMAGLILAVALLLWRTLRADIHAEELFDAKHWRLVVEGNATFLSQPKLTKVLAQIPPKTTVTIELSPDFLDHAAADVIEEWSRRHRESGGHVIVDPLGEHALDAATRRPPTRKSGMSLARGLSPWTAWQHQHRDDGEPTSPLINGLTRFHTQHAPLVRPHLDPLTDTQVPTTAFLTCSDSRVLPNLITASGPGDLFTIRNVGNLVPTAGDLSSTAAFSFALNELDIRSVVVCGHSNCGAMQALLGNRASLDGPLRDWLDQAEPSLQAFLDQHPVRQAAADQGFSVGDQLAMVNVAVQLDNLRAHPTLGPIIAEREVAVTGLFFDIATATVWHVLGDTIAMHTDDWHSVV